MRFVALGAQKIENPTEGGVQKLFPVYNKVDVLFRTPRSAEMWTPMSKGCGGKNFPACVALGRARTIILACQVPESHKGV